MKKTQKRNRGERGATRMNTELSEELLRTVSGGMPNSARAAPTKRRDHWDEPELGGGEGRSHQCSDEVEGGPEAQQHVEGARVSALPAS